MPTDYIIPKKSSNNRISAAFEEIADTLNNPELQEVVLNDNGENYK